MRKNAPRKWLHAILDLLPVIIIPVFMIYSHRHTIDNYSIEVPQNEVVDFNQQLHGFSNDYWTASESTLVFSDNGVEVTPLDNASFPGIRTQIEPILYNKYLINVYTRNVSEFSLNFAGFDGVFANNLDLYGQKSQLIVTAISNTSYFSLFKVNDDTTIQYYRFPECFNLTQMFGSGNEPTIEEFNTYFPDDYYDYTSSKKTLVKNFGTITYDDTDIGSQMLYCLYNSVDKYFNMNNIFGIQGFYDWLQLNLFSGNGPLYVYIVWQIIVYELVMDLLFLLYALFMFFIDFCTSLIERCYTSGKGGK